SFFQVSAAAAVLPTDSSSPKSGCVFLGIEGKYITQIQEAIDLINKIRLEACNEGVIDPNTGVPLTPGDYVPIKWSAGLEYVARIRAAEASITMAHKRLNGESIWDLKSPGGIRSYGEVIAWNRGETMTQGINQWYDEKKDWVNKTPGAVTGHYTQMIDPKHLYVGLGTFCSKSAKYYNTTVGEFCGSLNNPDTSRGSATGSIIQTLEVRNEYIAYNISGTDTLYVSAEVTFTDSWSNILKTKDLTLIGDSAKNVRWSSSNNDIVSVSDGKLTVKSCGSAVITAKLPGGSSLTKSVSYKHSYKTSTTAAACGTDGKIVNTCTVCGDTDTQIIPKTNQHSYKTSATAATCGTDGKIIKTCTVCGDTDTQTIPKTGQHSFGDWKTAKVPTADSDGLETRICSVCSTTESRTLRYEPQDTSGDINSSSDNSGSSPDSSSSGSSSEDSSSETSSDSSSSGSSTENSSSGTASGSSSSVTSSSSEIRDENTSGSHGVTSGTSDSAPSNGMMSLLLIGGVLAVGVIVLLICLIKRRRK
ncbi:MAG: CAP domain-containing protein, partial [Oscillospiraceae bacterium]|nr:CAP domain-containing protein [Oscillospiraceae bacterium]